MHAAICGVDVLERYPAGDAAVEEIGAPIAFVLVPIGWNALSRGLRQKLVVPEFELEVHQGRAEGEQPFAVSGLADLLPYERWRRLDNTERAILALLLLIPRPVI